MKTASRIARLEQEGRRLWRRIGYVQTLYDSERLRSASGHLQAALADLRIAKIGAEIRRPATTHAPRTRLVAQECHSSRRPKNPSQICETSLTT
jgi:hypothetical protein